MSRDARQASGLGGVIVTHGHLATELVRAAKMIVGETERLIAVPLPWDGDASGARAAIRQALGRVDAGAGVLLLTDMFGGTPTNLSLPFLEPGRVEIVTGVSLPMVVKFLNLPAGLPPSSAAAEIQARGREAIHIASEVLGRRIAGAAE
jgi:mannose PTS system EIIA component